MKQYTYWCDGCGEKIKIDRTRLELAIGPALPSWPTDLGTGRPTIDRCSECRDDLVGYLEGRNAARGVTDVA
jgi:hypothetical protein